MKRLYLGMIALVLGLSLALVGCNSGGGGPVIMESYTSEALGVTVDVPSNWVTEEADDQLTIANSEKSLSAEQIVDGAGVVVIGMPLADLLGMSDPVELLTIFQETFMAEATNAEILQDATARTVQGQPAASTKFKGEVEGQSGLYEVTVIVGATNLGIVLSVDTTDSNSFADTLTKIVDSVKLQ
jgi:hypothetical protein